MSNLTSIMPSFSIQQAGQAMNPFSAANRAAQNGSSMPENPNFQFAQLNKAQPNPGAPSILGFNNSWLC